MSMCDTFIWDRNQNNPAETRSPWTQEFYKGREVIIDVTQ